MLPEVLVMRCRVVYSWGRGRAGVVSVLPACMQNVEFFRADEVALNRRRVRCAKGCADLQRR